MTAGNGKQAGSILAQLEQPSFRPSKADRKLIAYMKSHPEEIPVSTIAALAEHVGVAESTVTRFVKKMGFASLNLFKVLFAKEFSKYKDRQIISHGIEHELSALYDCAHGAGLAVVMPAWMEYVKDADLRRFARFAERVWGVEKCDDLAAMADEGIARYTAWLKSIKLPTTFAELGAKEADIPQLAANLHLNGKTLGAFRPLNDADVAAILRIAAS